MLRVAPARFMRRDVALGAVPKRNHRGSGPERLQALDAFVLDRVGTGEQHLAADDRLVPGFRERHEIA